MLEVYRDFAENDLAIPVIRGRKTEREKFAGALKTYTIEALMGDGRALQAGTSHNLGQHFAKVFDITFLDQDDQLKYVWQASWGVSTRLIGAIIMVHGDDRGLKFPPVVAPVQVIIVPIMPKKTREQVLPKAREIMDRFKNEIRMEIDERDYSPGWKFNEWEMKGVPLRMEIGPKDLEKGHVVLVRRDTGEKIFVKEEELEKTLKSLLEEIQKNMFQQALDFRTENTRFCNDYQEFKEIIEEKKGLVITGWCGRDECEERIKDESKATIRCIPLEEEGKGEGLCICCGQEARETVYFARAY